MKTKTKFIQVANGKVKVNDPVEFLFQKTWYKDGHVYAIAQNLVHSGIVIQSGNGAKYHKNPKEVRKL